MTADVIVIGSGGAGQSAALAAAVGGAEVLLIEASPRWGGSTSVSGGQVWVPRNHRMAELGASDSLEEALRYCRAHAAGRPDSLVEAFVRAAPEMAQFVEAHSPIQFKAMRGPDSFAEQPGGKATGRHLEVVPLAAGALAPVDERFWTPSYPALLTNDEVSELRLASGGELPLDLIGQRAKAGEVAMGLGLVVGLMQGCLSAGVVFEQGIRARQLLRDREGRVCGVAAERDGEEVELGARRAVVLASGGFEWDPGLVASSLRGPVTHPVSPPLHRGDALRMAAEAGAALAYTSECWCWPARESAGSWPDPDSHARHVLVLSERFMPHVIWVNHSGRRFVNEASHNCALAFDEVDPHTHELRNVPAWAIGDAQFRSRYPVADLAPGADAAGSLPEAKTLAELAHAVGIDGEGLEAAVSRFNEQVRAGRDVDFGRGEAEYDRSYGDASAPHPNLGTLEEPPFFAMRVFPGAVGTKGGARTDERARVVDWSGAPIAGLYAAGNAMASTIGPGTIAPGLTLGLALSWGWVAGTDAAQS